MQPALLTLLFSSLALALPSKDTKGIQPAARGELGTPVLIDEEQNAVDKRTLAARAAPVVTDEAYIDTVIRHHNVHRLNHSAPVIPWSASLAATAQQIASSCVFAHNVTANGGGYGQNIGVGYLPIAMAIFINDLYYNEVNNYLPSYYGTEPNLAYFGNYGHFTQIVWKSTTAVGCYTQDCSATGVAGAAGALPYFTVCNYAPAGNVVGNFHQNVLPPIGNPAVNPGYECPNYANCAGPLF